MPIHCRIPLRRFTQQEFGELSYGVLREVFAIHNELGRFFEEGPYKRALAIRHPDIRLEEPIDVTFRTFTKQYFMDVLVASGGLFEFKAVDRFSSRHRAQLLHYLLLTELKHGMLVNVRSEKVEREFVNSALKREDRFTYMSEASGWDDRLPGALLVREILLELLADWGTCLELPLYEAGLTHFLGGDAVVLRPVQVLLDSTLLGEQPFRHAAEDVAFRLTAFEDPRAFERFLPQVDRLVRHTSLRALLWVNIARSRVTFTTVAPKEAAAREARLKRVSVGCRVGQSGQGEKAFPRLTTVICRWTVQPETLPVHPFKPCPAQIRTTDDATGFPPSADTNRAPDQHRA